MTQLAFLISAHTDPQHLCRLVKSLPASSEFFIHIDAKSDIRPFHALLQQPNVHFVKPRTDVMWGSIGVVDSQMAMIREALDSGIKFDYLISMSGLDYPLWSNERILDFFGQAPGRQYLHGVCMENQQEAARIYRQHRPYNYKSWRYGTMKSKFRVALRKILYSIGVRKPLRFVAEGKEYKLYKGSMWWAITPDLAQLAYDTWKKNTQYVRYFHDSFAPDETFIHTLVFNSDYAKHSLGEKERFTRLEDITPLTFIDYTHDIKVFDETDYDLLVGSGKMFFRKAITGKSDTLLDRIDRLRKG